MIVYVKTYDSTVKVQHYQCFFAPPQRFESLTACQKQQLSSLMKAAVSFYLAVRNSNPERVGALRKYASGIF